MSAVLLLAAALTVPSVTFTAPLPSVQSVTPSGGALAGGTLVVIGGSGFTGASAVHFGGQAAQSFSVSSDNSISARTPAGAAGIVSVTVTTPAGTSVPPN